MPQLIGKHSTRHVSNKQEKRIASSLNLHKQPNSGATAFLKGDLIGQDILIECKTKMQPTGRFTIQKDWLTKNRQEAFSMQKNYHALAFDFGDKDTYYVLDEEHFKLFLDAINKGD